MNRNNKDNKDNKDKDINLVLNQRLEVEGLAKSFHHKEVVHKVSLRVRQGEVVGLLGPNGAGKTTVFKMIVGLVKPDQGKILLNTHDIAREPMYKRARMGLGYLPQESSVFKKLSVEDNLMAVLEGIPMDRSQRTEKLEEILEEFNLGHLRDQKAETLSGGERRRLEIARALMTEPLFMLLDEPFVGIDPKAVVGIQDIVGQLKDKGFGVIITDHNVRETLAITDRSYIIFEGNVLMEGTSSELVTDERAREAYLGERFSL
jgi:lipopolysaccharide export system ATP-binding protein